MGIIDLVTAPARRFQQWDQARTDRRRLEIVRATISEIAQTLDLPVPASQPNVDYGASFDWRTDTIKTNGLWTTTYEECGHYLQHHANPVNIDDIDDTLTFIFTRALIESFGYCAARLSGRPKESDLFSQDYFDTVLSSGRELSQDMRNMHETEREWARRAELVASLLLQQECGPKEEDLHSQIFERIAPLPEGSSHPIEYGLGYGLGDRVFEVYEAHPTKGKPLMRSLALDNFNQPIRSYHGLLLRTKKEQLLLEAA